MGKSEIWNYLTTASNMMAELKNEIDALGNSSAEGLSINLKGLRHSAAKKAAAVEKARRTLFPEQYPTK